MGDRPISNEPPREQQRRRIPSDQEQQNEPNENIMDLDDASLGNILDFLPGHFRFVASVNRRFRFLYHHTPNTFYIEAMASDRTREIWLQEDETNVREKGCKIAAKIGNLEAIKWLRSHDCSWNSIFWNSGGVCSEAAAEGHLHILQ